MLFLSVLGLFGPRDLLAEELVIDRPPPGKILQEDGLPVGWKRLGEDRFRVRYRFPNIDLFWDSIDSIDPAKDGPARSVKKVFEDGGVPLGGSETAIFDRADWVLTIEATRHNLELVEVFFEGWHREPMKRIAVRAEIYEVTKLQALQLAESAQAAVDHTPEREAAAVGVKDGKAKLAALVSITTRSGQRAKVTDAVDFLYPDRAHDEDRGEGGFEVREVGTLLEIEPILDADGKTVSLNVAVEHHTAEPELAEGDGAAGLRFHEKQIQTSVNIEDGESLLLGSWTPTGKPEYAENNLCHVVFITTTVQRDDYWGIVKTVEEAAENK